MRLVATDLDGTIVRPDGTISQRTLDAFARCESAGVDVVYVTGRPPRWLGDVVAQTGHSGTAICGNGAVVYDLAAERVLSARTIPGDVVLDVARRIAEASPGSVFAIETLDGFRREPSYVPRYDMADPHPPAPLSELVDGLDIVKLLCRNGTSSADLMLSSARAALDGIANPTHSNPDDCLIEVSAEGVSKAVALAELVRSRGLRRDDVVAFGDMPNDIEMLRWAGRGFAMEGGHPEAIAAAGGTAPSCLDDGVAQVIERLLAEVSRPAPA
ncbi:MAG TPA: HAD family hydrolase [Actinomycetales bacterium]